MFTFKGTLKRILHFRTGGRDVKTLQVEIDETKEIQFADIKFKNRELFEKVSSFVAGDRIKVTINENEEIQAIEKDKFDPNWEEKGELPGEIWGDWR
jgi:hypothetical protein